MTRSASRPLGVAAELGRLLGPDLPVALAAYDGSRSGALSPVATINLRSPLALRRILAAPGQLGLARAYVAGDLEVDGDLFGLLRAQDQLRGLSLGPSSWAAIARLTARAGVFGRPPAPPPEEARVRGRRRSRPRDAAAIRHHYDVSSEFYRLLLGPSMTYSCAVWANPSVGLEAAQEAKYELVSRKLGLCPGQRLLDVGCGWGGMVLHAARHHGVRAVGVTLSAEQAALARRRVAEAGLADRVEIRLQDYRDVADGPFDAISSIGMFEHVGAGQLGGYFRRLHGLLRPGGRLLNHAISQPAGLRPGGRNGFIQRYVFPDGELQEIGRVVTAVQHSGFEVRHVESLREHYALTLRAWVRNLEERYAEAEAEVGPGRARVWRLYLAGSAVSFEAGRIEIHQTLAERSDEGRSGMPLRPDWEPALEGRIGRPEEDAAPSACGRIVAARGANHGTQP